MTKRSITKFAAMAFAGASLFATGVVADIPKPEDVTVTRENYPRIIQVLTDAGLSRSEIQRWMNASQNAPDRPGAIPNPQDIQVTRENYSRIVSALAGMGLTRSEIDRWMNASMQSNNGQADNALHSQSARAANGMDVSQEAEHRRLADQARQRANEHVSTRPDRAEMQNRVRPQRSARNIRPVRATRPVRTQRPVQPTRPNRPSRPGG